MKASTKASSIKAIKASSLRIVAGSTKLLRNHLLSVQSEFDKCNADKCNADKCNADKCNADKCNADKCNADKCDVISALRSKYALPILALLTDIKTHCKMVIRIQQVQRQKINQYRQSIINGRRMHKRGEHAPTDMIMDVMVPMTMRFIQDLKDTLPELTQPIITRIHSMLHDLHDRLSMFQMFADIADTDTTNDHVSCQCKCNSVGISCHACHQGAHEQCQCNCTE